jgi:hypothetical protein
MLHAGPVYIVPSLNSQSFGISEFHLRMRQICRPKLYNYQTVKCYCHPTWKRCKHSGHFSRFHIIIGNFRIVN